MKRRTRLRVFVLCVLAVGVMLGLSTCSPLYVVRAGWEEGKILWKREPIEKLVAKPETEAELKRKFQLVLDARQFAADNGLKPGESFTSYSDIGREVLIWVLSGSEKLAFRPATWWFPIVGRIPYKGFFDKDDGLKEAEKLKAKGFDFYLRTSPAFSTLGWFDDPLLSTTVNFDDAALVNTVLHEILHNTLWIPNHAEFNETLANVVGSVGAIEFFTVKLGAEHPTTQLAVKRWEEELEYAVFLRELIKELEQLYVKAKELDDKNRSESENSALRAELLQQREQLLEAGVSRWEERHPPAEPGQRRRAKFNNATILAQTTYLDRPELFARLYTSSGSSLANLVTRLKRLEEELRTNKEGPYGVVERALSATPLESSGLPTTPSTK